MVDEKTVHHLMALFQETGLSLIRIRKLKLYFACTVIVGYNNHQVKYEQTIADICKCPITIHQTDNE